MYCLKAAVINERGIGIFANHFFISIDEKDTLEIPNFGIQPKLEIHKGKNDYSCVVGFLDKKGAFKEYKQVAITDNQMKLTTLKKYFVGVYKTVSQ